MEIKLPVRLYRAFNTYQIVDADKKTVLNFRRTEKFDRREILFVEKVIRLVNNQPDHLALLNTLSEYDVFVKYPKGPAITRKDMNQIVKQKMQYELNS